MLHLVIFSSGDEYYACDACAAKARENEPGATIRNLTNLLKSDAHTCDLQYVGTCPFITGVWFSPPPGWTKVEDVDPAPNPILATRKAIDGGTANLRANGTVDAVNGSFYSVSPGFDSFAALENWILETREQMRQQ